MPQIAEPINIFSGAPTELGAALTNPTELSRQKGTLKRSYPVFFKGKRYPDAETAYQLLKAQSTSPEDLMAEILVAKFEQHKDLADAVAERGGIEWLKCCTHFTGARTDGAQAWEGAGLESRYIRVLVEGYARFVQGDRTEMGQVSLF
ncbi:hypothetical protein D3C71_23180 [compost metagenome]